MSHRCGNLHRITITIATSTVVTIEVAIDMMKDVANGIMTDLASIVTDMDLVHIDVFGRPLCEAGFFECEYASDIPSVTFDHLATGHTVHPHEGLRYDGGMSERMQDVNSHCETMASDPASEVRNPVLAVHALEQQGEDLRARVEAQCALPYELASDQRQRLSDATSGWLDSVLSTLQAGGVPHEYANYFDDPILEYVAEVTGTIDAYESRHIPRAFAAGVKVVMEMLISRVRAIEDHALKERLLGYLQERLFDGSPCIFSNLTIVDQLVVSAQANRDPEIQGWFGQFLNGETSFSLSWARDERLTDTVKEALDALTPAEKLDVLKHLETIAAVAVANGSWARPCVTFTEQLASELEHDDTLFVSLLAGQVRERILREQEDPSLSTVSYMGNRGAGRIAEAVRDDYHTAHDQVMKRCVADIDSVGGAVIVPIASDAFGVFDHAMDLRAVAPLNQEVREQMARTGTTEALPYDRLRALATFLDTDSVHDAEDFREAMGYVEQHIMSDIEQTHETVGWSHVFSGVDGAELSAFLAQYRALDNYQTRMNALRAKFQELAHERYLAASADFVQHVLDELSMLTDPQTRFALADVASMVEAGEHERAFELAHDVAFMLSGAPGGSVSKEARSVSGALIQQLEHTQGKILQEMNIAYDQDVRLIQEEARLAQEGFSGFVHSSDLWGRLHGWVEESLAQCRRERPRLDLVSVRASSMSDDPTEPFHGATADEREVYYRTLFNPNVRNELATKLGITWAEIDMRSQTYFMEYLLTADRMKFESLRHSLSSYQGNKVN